MELTLVEKRVIAVMIVCGSVSTEAFNTACNVDDIHPMARDHALDKLRGTEIVAAVYPLTNA